MKLFRKEEGFTLVELMVVVLIIGILVAIAIPVFNAAQANARNRSCVANQRTIQGAVQSFLADNTTMVAADVDAIGALAPDYIKAIPAHPGDAAAYVVTDGDVQGCPGAGATQHDDL